MRKKASTVPIPMQKAKWWRDRWLAGWMDGRMAACLDAGDRELGKFSAI